MPRRHRTFPSHPLGALLPALLAAAGVCHAADDAANPAEPARPAGEEAPPPVDAVLEATRSGTRSAAEWLARSVDSWFGDQPFEAGGKVSDGRLSLSVLHRRDSGTDLDLRFNARFRLPNVERQAYVFFGRDDPRDVIQDTPEAASRQQALRVDRAGERSFLGGLGLTLRDTVDFRIGLSNRLKPYVQARYEKPWQLSDTQSLQFRETVFWTAAERFGSTTALTYAMALTPTVALRWVTVGTITQETRNFEWSTTLGAYCSLGLQRQLALEAVRNGTGTRGTGVGASDYGVLLKWEQPLHKSWLLGEVVGGHFWPRTDAQSPRGRAWALGGSLRMRF